MAPRLRVVQNSGVFGLEELLSLEGCLSECLVLVPTAQSGRRLRLEMAETGGVLAPKIFTGGSLLEVEGAAPKTAELLAWVKVLEAIEQWDEFESLFPVKPNTDGVGWSLGMARNFEGVRRTLQEGGWMISDAANKISTLERDRWKQLARLEGRVEKVLRNWGLESRSSVIARGGFHQFKNITRVVVSGVFDLPIVVTDFLEKSDLPVEVFVPDPHQVDQWGRPEEAWLNTEIGWPKVGSVHLVLDAGAQAEEVVRKVSEGGFDSNEVAVGTGDEEIAPELVRTFERSGWLVSDPGEVVPSSMKGFLSAWRRFLGKNQIAEAIDVLGFLEGETLIGGYHGWKVEMLCQLRDDYLAQDLNDIKRLTKTKGAVKALEAGLAVMNQLENWRLRFLKGDFIGVMREFLNVVDPGEESEVWDWIHRMRGFSEGVHAPVVVWLDLLVGDLDPSPLKIQEERVLDIEGWLELFHNPSSHLVICGMNEGRIPSGGASDSWLPESARKTLSLSHESSIAARDTYLFNAMLERRKDNGRVDIVVGKVSGKGDVLMPSRLLLLAKGAELARRVDLLFAEVRPREAGMSFRMEEQWKWVPRGGLTKNRVSVTGLSKYLACPFRFYLSEMMRLQARQPERMEWNARDFGTIVHEVLEEWGRDEIVRNWTDEIELEEWLLNKMEEVVTERFGDHLPLGVGLQVESLKLRLGWFAERQAALREEGWEVIEVERNFELEIDGMIVRGQIDRVDRHPDTGRVRVLDYKTSAKAKNVVTEHLRKARKDDGHLAEPVIGPNEQVWTNLQVPIYAKAVEGEVGAADEIGYFAIGETKEDIGLRLWDDWNEKTASSAWDCARWIVSQLKQGVFWPPKERVVYDDFSYLGCGHPLIDAVVWEGNEQ